MPRRVKTAKPPIDRLEDRRLLSTVPAVGPGAFDTGFGTAGVVYYPGQTGGVADYADAESIAVSPGGSFFVGGRGPNGSAYVRRYNADGSVDGTYGPVPLSFGANDPTAVRVAGLKLDSAGRLLVGLTEDGIVRLTTAGAVDTTFGQAGYAAVGGLDEFTTDGAGRILTSATNGATSSVQRLTTAGIPDSTFGTVGVANAAVVFGGTTVGGTEFLYHGSGPIAVQADGKILVGGRASMNPGAGLTVERLNADGSVDTAFGSTGLATYAPFSPSAIGEATTLSVLPDGTILAGGFESTPQNFGLNTYFSRAVQFTPSGKLDTADFGQGAGTIGLLNTGANNLSERALLTRTLVQPDGKLLFIGTVSEATSTSPAVGFFIERTTAQGTPDSTFGTGGFETTTFAQPPQPTGQPVATALDAAVTAGGKLLTAGSVNTVGQGFVLAQFDLGLSGTTTVSQLNGVPIGTAGSWDGRSGIDKVFDGDLNTYFDAPTGSLSNWVGLDLGTPQVITAVKIAPRVGFESRVGNAQLQVSSTADFSADVHTLYQFPYGLTAGQLTNFTVNSGSAYRYVRYVGGNQWVNLAELQVFGPASTTTRTFTGGPIGTPGSWDGRSGVDKVFDGNLSTFFDPANGSLANWAGLDLGTPRAISQISFAPRAGYEFRMVGGQFQLSSSADFSSDVHTVYTVTTTPVAGQLTKVSIPPTAAYRYVRYVGGNQWVNIAEMQVAGPAVTAVQNLGGAVIGTPGGYTSSRTIAAAVDGNLDTFYDPADGSLANWVGLDLGSAKQITRVGFAPRAGYGYRMVNALIQVSSTADFSSDVHTVYTISSTPSEGKLTTVSVAGGNFRYIRFVGGTQWVNIAELQFGGY